MEIQAITAGRPDYTNALKPSKAGGKPLSDEEEREVQELKTRDQAVRAHEQAHMGAAGGLARGGPSFEYEKGPDGKSYAVGGEVSIDTSSARTPQETIAKMQQVQAAALAPADPSPQDRQVAAAAAASEAEARQELARQKSSPQKNLGHAIDLFA